jgi:hypothetical protein
MAFLVTHTHPYADLLSGSSTTVLARRDRLEESSSVHGCRALSEFSQVKTGRLKTDAFASPKRNWGKFPKGFGSAPNESNDSRVKIHQGNRAVDSIKDAPFTATSVVGDLDFARGLKKDWPPDTTDKGGIPNLEGSHDPGKTSTTAHQRNVIALRARLIGREGKDSGPFSPRSA